MQPYSGDDRPAEGEANAARSPQSARSAADSSEAGDREWESGLSRLPRYTRSLLRIRVPATVTLARSRCSVQRLLELSPGALLQFDKSCEETLRLEVGGCEVAEGEAVKVGDKFGLRITSMVLPHGKIERLGGEAAAPRPEQTPPKPAAAASPTAAASPPQATPRPSR